MKKILFSLILLLMAIVYSSCAESVYAVSTDDVYGTEYYESSTDVTLIITYGTPYYYDGHLWYYYYNNLYYYPFYYDGYWYLRPYTRLYPWGYDFGRFRPNRYDYRYRPHRPHGHNPGHNPGYKPNIRPNHPGNHSGHGVNPSQPKHPRNPSNMGSGRRPSGSVSPGRTSPLRLNTPRTRGYSSGSNRGHSGMSGGRSMSGRRH